MPDIPLIARVSNPSAGWEERLRRFTELLAIIVNSLSRQNILRQIGPTDFTIDLSELPGGDGLIGPPGPPGPPGPAGVSIITGGNPPSDGRDGKDGDLFIEANGDIFQKKSPFFGAPARWRRIAQLSGFTGPRGIMGPQGVGMIGPKGDKGDKGDAGTGGGSEDEDWAQDLTFVSFRG